ncbi:bile acid:sodium symporter family protein [Psychrobacter sp. FDAARGOS_221]|uniref:bile acid:sodium symporter family protein n=1 Tax=Psychrobacter sp. FDAARGOS_221 TaxID=1975705 RepID=UPI000BB571E7|nr:bile acid:sodium symporter [Psychrobacter sp. FDAARGOS_221]PNK59818.1 bile acid:sodium symporter family protein [Psychrobacter sp. FDAARGOS_221]
MFQLLPLFLAFIMFALGLQTQLSDFKQILINPKALVLGLAMQLLLVPFIAYMLVIAFNLTGSASADLGFGIMLLSICAGGITSNMMSWYAGGTIALSISLTAITSIIAILTVPLWVQFLYPLFFNQLPVDFSMASLSLRVLFITTIPVLLGISARHYFPSFIDRWQNRIQQVANVLFGIMVIGATVSNWTLMVSQITQIGILVLLMALMLLISSLLISTLFKLNAPARKTIAIEVSLQNGAMGIALASLLSQTDALSAFAMPSAIYGVLMNFIVLPFVFYQGYRYKQQGQIADKKA